MSLDDSGLAIAEQATRALGSLERYGHVLRPTGADETAWRLEMLEELVRAGHRLAGAVGRVVGDDDPAVDRMVSELRSAVDEHCERLVRAVRDHPDARYRRTASGGDRVVPFPTPYVRPHGDVPRPTGAVAPAGNVAPAGDVAPSENPAARTTVDPSIQRVVIGRAAEVLMSRLGLGVDAAYALILERARDTGTSTYEVAARVVEED